MQDNLLVIIDGLVVFYQRLEAEPSDRSYTDLNAETFAQPPVSSHVNLGHVYFSLKWPYDHRVRHDTRRHNAMQRHADIEANVRGYTPHYRNV